MGNEHAVLFHRDRDHPRLPGDVRERINVRVRCNKSAIHAAAEPLVCDVRLLRHGCVSQLASVDALFEKALLHGVASQRERGLKVLAGDRVVFAA